MASDEFEPRLINAVLEFSIKSQVALFHALTVKAEKSGDMARLVNVFQTGYSRTAIFGRNNPVETKSHKVILEEIFALPGGWVREF